MANDWGNEKDQPVSRQIASTNWGNEKDKPVSTAGDRVADAGRALLSGAIAVPEAAVGLADIATGGRVGKFLENEGGSFGSRPKQARQALGDMDSNARKFERKQFANADGVVGKTIAAVQNPALIANAAIESVPAMFAGGVAGGALAKAIPAVGRIGAGAVGEGLVMAGGQAEQIRGETSDGLLTPTQSAIAAATGVGGAALGRFGAKVAGKLGVGDIDEAIANGALRSGTTAAKSPGIVGGALRGAVAEGVFEELPQSLLETGLQNVALGRDVSQGMDEAAVMGVLTGGAMGFGMGGLSGIRGKQSQQANDGAGPGQPVAGGQSPVGPLPSVAPGMSQEQHDAAMSSLEAQASEDLKALRKFGGSAPAAAAPQATAQGAAPAQGAAAPIGSTQITDPPFLDRALTVQEQMADPAVREAVRARYGDQGLGDLAYYAGVATRGGMPEKTMENLLQVAERMVSTSIAPQIQRASVEGGRARDPVLESGKFGASPLLTMDGTPTGVLLADQNGQVVPETQFDRINSLAAKQKQTDLGKQAPVSSAAAGLNAAPEMGQESAQPVAGGPIQSAGGFGFGRSNEVVDVQPIQTAAGMIGTPRRIGESPVIDVESRLIEDPAIGVAGSVPRQAGSSNAPKRSAAMGINPEAGPMQRAAALAVDGPLALGFSNGAGQAFNPAQPGGPVFPQPQGDANGTQTNQAKQAKAQQPKAQPTAAVEVTQPAPTAGTTGEGAGASRPTQAAPEKPAEAATVQPKAPKEEVAAPVSARSTPQARKRNLAALKTKVLAGRKPGALANEGTTPQDGATKPATQAEDAAPFVHGGLKIRMSEVKIGGQVANRWLVQSPENAERESRGERQIGGDRILETREQAVQAAEQELQAHAERKATKANADAQEAAKKAQDEARKTENRGKSIAQRHRDAVLDKPSTVGQGTKREVIEAAVRNGRAIVEKMVDDTAAKKRDREAVDRVSRAGYMLGLSNENIPVVKAGLEAQARLKANKYEKPEYRMYTDGRDDGPFREISKTEYDHAQAVKAKPVEAAKPAPAPAPKVEELPDGWTARTNGFTGRPVYRFDQGVGQPFAVVTRTEMGYEVQIRHGDKLVDSANMPGAAKFEALSTASEMLAKVATHKDPGEKPEAATPAVVTESLKKAAKNEDVKPSDMKKWLLGELDKAMLVAPDRSDYDDTVKGFGAADAVKMWTGNGRHGKDTHTGFLSFDVPGDGKFKVRNGMRGLLEFRQNVEHSKGFSNTGARPVAPVRNSGVQNGSSSQMTAITNMIEEGDFEAARDYAEAVGIALADVKVPRGERKPQWDAFMKDGTLPLPPDTKPRPAPKTAAQLDEEKRQAAEAEAKKPKDTGWNMAGTGYGGKRYIGRNITTDDGREIVARIYQNVIAYEEVEIKVDGVRKFAVRDSYNAQDKADAFIRTLMGSGKKITDKLAAQDKMTPRQFDDWIRQRATIQTEQFRGDRNHGGGDEGVGYIHLSGSIEAGGTNWAGTARGAKDKRDTRLIFRTDDNKIVWYDDGSQQVYEVPKDDTRLEITRPEPMPKQARDPQEITVTVDGSDYTVTFDEPLATISNQAFQDNLDEYGTPGVAKAEFRKLRAQAKNDGATKPTNVTPQVSGNPEKFIKVAADSVRELRAMDVDRVLTETPVQFRGEVAMHIKGKRPDLAGEVDDVMADLRGGNAAPAAPAQPAAEPAPEQEAPKLTQAEAADLMGWVALGTKDGVTKHILTFYESKADKDANRGRMTMATVSKGDRSPDHWMVEGDDQKFGIRLAAAKKRGIEIGMAKAMADGFVQRDDGRETVNTANDKQIGTDLNGKPVYEGTDGALKGVPYAFDERGKVRTGVAMAGEVAAKPELTKADVPTPAQKPASKSPAMDAHAALMDAVRTGKATPEQFKAGFEAVVAGVDAIKAELGTHTKADLLKMGGPYMRMRYASENKPEIIDALYREMLGEFLLGESLTYGMGKNNYRDAIAKRVEAVDADKLAKYVTERQAAIDEVAARRVAAAKALADPKTLDDFKAAIRAAMMDGKTRKEAHLTLTPEQRIRYDELDAESTREARETRKRAQKTQVQAAGQATGGQIIATKHTKAGYDLFVVQLSERLSKEDYTTVLASAKRMGGWYSAFRGNGAVPGFQFKDKASAEAFLKLAGGDAAAAQEQTAQRRDAFEDDRSQTAAERLTEMADRLEGQADEELGRDRKANTARRARFAASAEAAASNVKALAKTMRNIAAAIGEGRAKFLDAVRQKTQVEMLAGVVNTAKYSELVARFPEYADREKRKGEPPTTETADFAEFPAFTAFRSDLATLARQMLEVDGTKKLGQQLMSVADDVTDAYLDFAKGNLLAVSQFGRNGAMADFGSKTTAEAAIRRSGLVGKAIVLPIKRGENRVILSPSEAMNRGVWMGDGDKRITLSNDAGMELVQAIGRKGNQSNGLKVPWQFETAADRLKALSRMGIETPAEFRSAVREFISLRVQAQEADRVKAMERAMVGRKADGLDFFPTPAEVADQMVEAAGIAPDMAVLEPSAGMGHLADRIRAAGAEPDVVELSGDRRELLEEKGFTVVGHDFMQMKPRTFFTYGDVFRAPDGKEGVMRGQGGMGSDRVRLVDDTGNILGYYNRDELTGVRHGGTESGYDRIIMNPPFGDRRDAEHVRHAYSLLKPGGRLVAIMGEGVFFGKDKKAEDFREWLDELGGTSEKLPEGSFMDPSLPVTTGVNARMVVVDRVDGEGGVRFSRAAPSVDEQRALDALSGSDELFALPRPTADTIEDIAAEIDPEIKIVQEKADPGQKLKYKLTMPGGEVGYLYVRAPNPYGPSVYAFDLENGEMVNKVEVRPGENPDDVDPDIEDVYIDVSKLSEGGGGNEVYAIAGAFAHGTGRMFIGDPAGLSDEAMRRRPEAMLSLALKYGTTDFMAPHPRQMRGDARLKIPGLTWVYGDSVGNIKRLVELNVKALDNAFPDSAKVTFDERTGSFVNTDTGKVIGLQFLGARLARSRSAGASEAGAALAGRKTVARGAVWRALLRQSREATGGADGGRNGLLAGLAGIAAQSGSATKGLFSRRVKPAFSRGAQVQANGHVQQIVDLIRSRWANAPKVVVAFDMDDPAIPERVRQEDQRQRSGGATGTPEGFYYKGTVYLMSSKLATNRDVVRVLFHEALGHYGLRGVFGKELKPLLQQIATMRKAQIDAKMKEYGLRGVSSVDRLIAAEEILAEMAQDSPQIGFVRRAIATIKAWLRKHIPGFMGMKMTDDEIITRFILPARNFVVNGGNGNIEARGAAFSRPVVPGFDFDRPWRDLILKNKFSDYDTPAEISVTRHDDHVPGTGQTYSAPKEFVFGVQNDSGWVSLHVEEMDGPYSGDKVLTSALEAVYPKGTGIATKLYLAALNVAQKTNRGWLSEGIRSDNSLGIYERLEKAGIPFAQVGRKSYISAADLNGVDLAAVASRLSGGPNGGPGGGVRFNRDGKQPTPEKRESQIESENFKRWFGDWGFDEATPVSIIEAGKLPFEAGDTSAIREWLLSDAYSKEPVTNLDSGVSIEFTSRGLKDSLKRRGDAQRTGYTVLRELIESAKFVDFEKSDRDHLAGQDVYYAAMRIGGTVYSVRIKADVRKDRTSAYKDHKVEGVDSLIDVSVLPAVNKGDTNGALGYPGNTGLTRASSTVSLGDLVGNNKPSSSKVVDADGKPLVVYHATNEDFDAFEVGRETNNSSAFGSYTTARHGIFTSPDVKFAEQYLKNGSGQNVMPVYVSAQNIVDMREGLDGATIRAIVDNSEGLAERDFYHMEPDQSWEIFDGDMGEKVRSALMAAGFDGVRMVERGDDGKLHDVYVAFDPIQIKSATGNNGDFDAGNPDIRFSRSSGAQSIAQPEPEYFSLKDRAGDFLKHWRGMGLQALGLRQLVDVYGDLLPQINRYSSLVQQMAADKNESGAEADALTREWAALGKDSGRPGEEVRLAELMHEATLAQIDPDKPHQDGDSKAEFNRLVGLWNALSPQSQALYRQARQMYSTHFAKVKEAIADRIERSGLDESTKRKMVARLDDQLLKQGKGVYFPLARFGKYVVVVKDGGGNAVSVSRAETLGEANAMRAEVLKAYPKANGYAVSKVYKDQEFSAARDAAGKGFMADLVDLLREGQVDDGIIDSVGQLYLASLPDLSWAKHGMHRKGTPGFSQDARRAFAQNMFHGARHLAKLRYADQLSDQLLAAGDHIQAMRDVDGYDNIQAAQVLDEMTKRHDILMKPPTSPVSTALTSAGFVYFMGLSPASALVNLTQTALVAFPVMAAKWGAKKSADALVRASAEVVRAKNDLSKVLSGNEAMALQQAINDGTIDVTMAHDLAGIAQGEDQRVTWAMRPAMRAASFMFHHAEKFNRQATFIAAYRLAVEAGSGHDVAFEQAKKATYDGHFDYSAENRPRVMQGNWQKVLFLFKQYGQNMVYLLSRQAYLSTKGLTPEDRMAARKLLAGVLTMHAMAAGALGLPLVGALLSMASFIGGDDDEPWDAEVALKNMLAETFGQKPAEVMAHGLSRLTPWDLSGRVALNKLILPDIQEGLEGQRLGEAAMAAMLGPVAGIPIGVLKGMQSIGDGHVGRGLEEMMPIALRNPLKSIRLATEGNQDRTGVAINDEVSAAGVIGQALGLRPAEVALATEGRGAIYQHDKALMDRRSTLVRMYSQARMAEDADGVADVLADIRAFNAKNPERKLTIPHLLQGYQARIKRQREAEQGVYLPEKRRDALAAGAFAVTEDE